MRGSVFKESFIFCFSLLFALSLESNATEVLVINDANKDFFLSDKHVSIIEDKDYKIGDVTSERFKSIFEASRIKGNGDNLKHAYWYRFSIKNSLRHNEQLIYELLNFQLDKINLYIPDDQERREFFYDAYLINDIQWNIFSILVFKESLGCLAWILIGLDRGAVVVQR